MPRPPCISASALLIPGATLPLRSACALQPTDVEKAGAHVGFPAVIKPVSGAASIGVIRVNNLQELKTAYDRWVQGTAGPMAQCALWRSGARGTANRAAGRLCIAQVWSRASQAFDRLEIYFIIIPCLRPPCLPALCSH